MDRTPSPTFAYRLRTWLLGLVGRPEYISPALREIAFSFREEASAALMIGNVSTAAAHAFGRPFRAVARGLQFKRRV
jgi:hypothetical protein